MRRSATAADAVLAIGFGCGGARDGSAGLRFGGSIRSFEGRMAPGWPAARRQAVRRRDPPGRVRGPTRFPAQAVRPVRHCQAEGNTAGASDPGSRRCQSDDIYEPSPFAAQRLRILAEAYGSVT
jgi:hypothetical protein